MTDQAYAAVMMGTFFTAGAFFALGYWVGRLRRR